MRARERSHRLGAVSAMLLATCVLARGGEQPRTRVAGEKYHEDSVTDVELSVGEKASPRATVRVFEIDAKMTGRVTLLCFIDGNVWSQVQTRLPAQYQLSTRGLRAGKHRVTFQVVDARERVATHRLVLSVVPKRGAK